jgi:ribosome maturation factor RimP
MRHQAAIETCVSEAVASLNHQFWGMDFIPGKQQVVLRIYIEGQNGVTIDDCAQASRQIARCLEVENLIPGRFTLEVSSPGFDRTLYRKEQYLLYVGQTIDVRLRAPVSASSDRRHFKGVLKVVGEDGFTLQVEKEDLNFSFSQVMKATLVTSIG